MPSPDLPTADIPIFAFLLSACGMMCCFGFLFFWLMQPTILSSKEFVQAPLRPATFVLAPSIPGGEREKASLMLAQQENAEQELKASLVVTAAIPEAKPPRTKPKRIAKARKRDQPREQPNSWTYANHVSPFGGWVR